MEKNSIDRKFFILAYHATKGTTYSEKDAILFLAKDKALPGTLRFYLEESKRLEADQRHLKSVALLIDRVESYQKSHPEICKVPGVDEGAEYEIQCSPHEYIP